MNKKNLRNKQILKELKFYHDSRSIKNHEKCLLHLGRAHIIAQGRWYHHFYIHFLMFEYAWSRKDFKELFGQTIRMIATVPGNMSGKLPKGNVGWSSVGLLTKMPIPEDLKDIL